MTKNIENFLLLILAPCLFRVLPSENINSYSAIYDSDGNGKFQNNPRIRGQRTRLLNKIPRAFNNGL